MAISRERKEAFVAEYVEKLSRSQAAYIADYRGLSVSDISALRTSLRESGDNELTVAKNTLLRLAFEQSGLPVPEAQLEGPTAVLFCFDDPITPAKALKKYSDKSDFLAVKGGMIDGRVVDEAGFQAMADLPSREEILATLVGMIQAPAQELFGTLIAPMREIAQVLHAHSEQGE
ncbi:MAG: 50S ribosomal protein L10 [Anaerolineales bacterium]|nr:50S ribosomal protein L10 [Anaerolineales bacterium]MCB9127399.1 50S ribosomal protein L10 [Ardenticatenales bacterium]